MQILGRRKLLETESYPPSLRAANNSTKMLAGQIG